MSQAHVDIRRGTSGRTREGKSIFKPDLELVTTGNRGGAFKQAIAGESNREWSMDERPLVQRAVEDNRYQIPTDQPGGLFTRRMAEAIESAGGYARAKGSGKLGTLIGLAEEGILWEIPTKRVRRLCAEALGTGTFDSILLDVQNKRLQRGFRLRTPTWDRVVSFIKNVTDFKTQYAIQTGSFGLFPSVPAHVPYPNVQFTDDSATYTVAKYGGIYATSFEAITNDDLQVLGRTAEKFGMGFAQTIDEFVIGQLIDANPTIYDGAALFSAGHSNDLGTGNALGHDSLEDAAVLLAQQTDLDGEPLELRPWALLVNPAEEWIARRLLESERRPGTGNNDTNVFRGELPGGILVSARVTAGTWYLLADPQVVDTIEFGFLGGRREPELFEENELAGRFFEFEEKRFRGRMIFGGAVIEYRGFVRGQA